MKYHIIKFRIMDNKVMLSASCTINKKLKTGIKIRMAIPIAIEELS